MYILASNLCTKVAILFSPYSMYNLGKDTSRNDPHKIKLQLSVNFENFHFLKSAIKSKFRPLCYCLHVPLC